MSSNDHGAVVPAARLARRHDVDALRVLAFSLLIIYHVGMFYVADWSWHVKSDYQAEWLQLPMTFVNQWRMPLIFLVSGLALSFVWGKYSPLRLARRRLWRLGLPLAFGMAVIVAPQAYLEAVSKGAIEPGFWRFMGMYLTFGDVPAEAYEGAAEITWTWNHLWYLPYLLLYTLLLLPIAMLLDGPGRKLVRGFRGLRGIAVIVIPVLPLIALGYLVFPGFPYVSHALIDDGYAHVMYGTYFLYGFLLGRDNGIWAELARLRRVTLALGLILFPTFYVVANAFGGDTEGGLFPIALSVTYLNRWVWIAAVLGWGHAWLNRPMRWLPYATEAVYSWYILHQTITVVAGYRLSKLDLGPVVEPMLLLAVTVTGCYVLHEFVIRRSALLRPLFGLATRDSRPVPSPAGVADRA